MKRFSLVFALAFAMIASAVSQSGACAVALGTPQETHGKKHELGVWQYESFHDALHPLQHEALPGKDFRRIRANSSLLVRRGQAIVRLGIPRGVTEANRAEFTTELKKFREANARFSSDARKGTDAELEASFSALHDSFEMLVPLLPRR